MLWGRLLLLLILRGLRLLRLGLLLLLGILLLLWRLLLLLRCRILRYLRILRNLNQNFLSNVGSKELIFGLQSSNFSIKFILRSAELCLLIRNGLFQFDDFFFNSSTSLRTAFIKWDFTKSMACSMRLSM